MSPLVAALNRLAAPQRGALLLGAALHAAESGFALAVPLLAGAAAGAVLGDRHASAPVALAALLAVLTAQGLLRFASGWVLGRAGHALQARWRAQLFAHLLHLPPPWLHSRARGDLLSVITVDTWRVSQYLTGALASLAGLALMVGGAAVLMARMDVRLALACLAVVPAFWLLVKLIGRRVRPLAHAASEAEWLATSHADERLAMMTEIKAFVREGNEQQRFESLNTRWRSLADAQLAHASGLPVATQWLAGVAVVAVFWFSTSTAGESGAATPSPATMITFLLYAALLARPVSAIADLYGQTQTMRAALDRIIDILAAAPEGRVSPGALSGPSTDAPHPERASGDSARSPSRRTPPRIEFRDVSFAHPGRPPCLVRFNLDVAPGEVVALTGPNGAGKSTVVQLLLRFVTLGSRAENFLPDRVGVTLRPLQSRNNTHAESKIPPDQVGSGTILLDGLNINEIDPKVLRGWIGYVPQHTTLCSGTVRENIAFGRPDAGEDAIREVARLAGADEFVAALPQQYDTAVGESGVRLSGGQRQRIALARALLVDPPIVVLDEATSMFDSATERNFFEHTLPQIAHGRTVLLVVHGSAAQWARAREVALGPCVLGPPS